MEKAILFKWNSVDHVLVREELKDAKMCPMCKCEEHACKEHVPNMCSESNI
jgi:hypothetical protein